MGKVYLARVEGPGGFDKLVALKCIHPHLVEEPDFVEMFLDEARIAARITHPHVCSVFDFGCEDGVYYIAMEYLLGETVAKIVRRLAHLSTPPPRAKVAAFGCRIIVQAAEGLHVAHELKGDDGENLRVVHRDVSPQNLFVGYDGNVQVMDFGIATAAGRLHSTKAGSLKGKLAYMAPEQLDRQELDRRADIWGLGVVLWELLTGRRLFRRRSELDTMVALAQSEIQPPSTIEDGLPPAVDAIVMRALSRNPEERYATARDLAVDLSRFMNRLDEPVGVPELAQWMEELFHEERAMRLQLVEEARRSSKRTVPKPATPVGEEVSSSQVRVFSSEADALTALKEDVSRESREIAAKPAPPKPAPPKPAPRRKPAPPRPVPLAEEATEVTPAPTPEQLAVPAAAEPPEPAIEPVASPAPVASFTPPPETPAASPPVAVPEVSVPPVTVSEVSVPPVTVSEVNIPPVTVEPAPVEPALAEPAPVEPAPEQWPPADASAAEPLPLDDDFPAAPPRSKRTPLLVGGVLLLAAAVVGLVVVSGGEESPSDEGAAQESELTGPVASDDPMEETLAPEDEAETSSAAAEVSANASPMRPVATAMRRRARMQRGMTGRMAEMMQAAPVQQTGTVAVVALGGWADVFEGNRRLGRTPARVDLPAGRHTLRLRPFGMAPAVRRTVNVRPGAVTNLAVPVAE